MTKDSSSSPAKGRSPRARAPRKPRDLGKGKREVLADKIRVHKGRLQALEARYSTLQSQVDEMMHYIKGVAQSGPKWLSGEFTEEE